MELRVLFVDDSPDDVQLMLRRLRAGGLDVAFERVDSESGLEATLAAGRGWDIALVDYNLPGFDGITALHLLARLAPDLPAITVSGAITEDTAVATLTAGAVDYVLKDNLARLSPAVTRAVEGAELRRRQRRDAEQARQSQFAVDHAAQAIFYVGEDGRILYMNHAAEGFGGVPAGDAIGSPVWGWSPLVTQPEDWTRMWEQAAAGPIVDLEAPVLRLDGRSIIVQVTLERLERESDPFMIVYVRDLSRQREAEERALETEARYGRLTDSLPDIIFRYDLVPEHRLTYINQAVETLTGYSPEECYADPLLMVNFAHPDDAGIMEAALTSITVPSEPVVMRWIGKDGCVRWMESRVVPVSGAGGELVAVEGVTRDVTEVRRATEQLAHSRDLLDYVVAHDRSAVAIHDRELRYIYVSERFLADYRLQDREVIGRRDDEVFCGLSGKWRDVHRRALAGQVLAADRDLDERADHSPIWLCWECRPWYEADGSVGGIVFYSEDITDSVLAEQSLSEGEERFRRVSQTITDFAYSCLSADDGAFGFDWLSGATESITGFSHEDLLEWGCWRPLVVEEDVPVFEKHVTGLPVSETGTCELRIRRRDGEVRWLASYAEMIQDERVPGAHRLYGACQDITARKEAEEQTARSHDLLAKLARLVPGVVYQYRLYPDGSSAFPYSSPGMNDIYEYSPEEVREDATPVFARLHPDDFDRVSEDILRSARTLETFYCEFRVVLPRQGLRWRWSQAHPERTEDGGTLWHGIISDITERKLAEEEVLRHAERLRRTVEGAVLAMGHVVETRDPYTAGHERRVAELAVALGAELALPAAELEGLRLAALIHDIGKIAVPAEILAKPGRLSEVEFNLIRQHARAGYEILAAIDFGAPVAEIVLQHHERLDGSGYPEGLAGAQILFAARILAVADTVEAMSSHRPYRPALGMEAALAEVRSRSGSGYDPEVAAACLRVVEEQGFAFTP